MLIKRLLLSTGLCCLSVAFLSAATPADKAGNKGDGTEMGEAKPSWVERVFGAGGDDPAKDETEKRREEAEERAKKARKQKEEEEEKETADKKGKPGWVERWFGLGGEPDEDRDEPMAEAEGKGKGNDRKTRMNFNKEERKVLEDWQRGEAGWKKSGKRLPPGLQKKVARGGELPPGWKKKLAVGDKLPEEYESKAESVPEAILKRLPETPEQTEIIRIGDEVIRVMENTREIIDILGKGQSQPQD